MNQTEIDTFTGSPTPVEAARMKIWCDTPSIYRGSDVIGDVKVLDELIKLKHTDPKAIDHLFYYKNRPTSGDAMTDVHVTGGHKLQLAFSGSNSHIIVNNGIEILDPNFIHFPVDPSTGLQIIPPNTTNNMIKYINNTNNMGYRTVPRVDGHIDHRNILIKKDPQPIHQYQSNEYVLNGIVYEKKKLHTQIRSDWDENDIIYQLSYALANKIRRPSKDWIMHNAHNTNDTAIIKAYVGTLINGYKVHIHHANFHRYNLGSIFFDSYTSFKFLKFKTI